MKARNAILLLAAFAIIPLSIAAAQVPSARPPASDPHSVTITFFVSNGHGRPITALQESDVSVLDNGKPPLRVVSLGSAKERPLRLGILIDSNPDWERPSSELGQFDRKWLGSTKEEALDFARRVLTGPDDKAFIATYASVRHGATFLTPDQLRPIDLDQFLKADAPDFLGFRDAVRFACRDVFRTDAGARERRVLVVIPWTRGRSLSDYSQTVSAAQRAGVKVFVMAGGLVDTDGVLLPRGGVGWWGELVGPETGGYWAAPIIGQSHWFERLASYIDSMYRLTYIPEGPYQSGKLRRLDLKIITNRNWRVYAPKRYPTPSTP